MVQAFISAQAAADCKPWQPEVQRTWRACSACMTTAGIFERQHAADLTIILKTGIVN
jgi:hypothetical protein